MSSLSNMIVLRYLPRFSRQNIVIAATTVPLAPRISNTRELSASPPTLATVSHTSVRGFSKVKDSYTKELFLEEGFGDVEYKDNNLQVHISEVDAYSQILPEVENITDVFTFLDKSEDLTPNEITQALVTLHYLQKLETCKYSHVWKEGKELKYFEFNNEVLEHEKFQELISHLDRLADQLSLQETALNLMILRKLGMQLSDEIIVKLYLKMVHSANDLDISSLSLVTTALRARLYNSHENYKAIKSSKLRFQPFVQRLSEILESCESVTDFKKITTAMCAFPSLFSKKMMRQYVDKFLRFVEEGKYSDSKIDVLRKHLIFAIQSDDCFKFEDEYVSQLLRLHIGKVHLLSPSHLGFLSMLTRKFHFPISLYEECYEALRSMLAKTSFEDGEEPSAFLSMFYLDFIGEIMAIKSFGLPHPEISQKLSELLESPLHLSYSLENFLNIFLIDGFRSADLWEKFISMSVKLLDGDSREIALLADRFGMVVKKNPRKDRSLPMMDEILKVLHNNIEENSLTPTIFCMNFQSLLIWQQTFPHEHMDKFFEFLPNMNAGCLRIIHRGLRLRVGKYYRTREPLKSRDQQSQTYQDMDEISLAINRRSHAILMDPYKEPNLTEIIALLSLFERNVSYDECHYNALADKFVQKADILTTQTAKQCSRTMMLVSTYFQFPHILEKLQDFYCNNKDLNDISIRSLHLLLFACYKSNYPVRPELLKAMAQNLYREMDLISGRIIILTCEFLAFNNALPEYLIREIFTSEFMERLDKEMQQSNLKYEKDLRNALMCLNRSVVLKCPDIKVPWFHEEYCKQNAKTFHPNGNFKLQVYDELCNALGSWKYVIMNAKSRYYNSVDFQIGLDAHGNVLDLHSEGVNPARNIAIQAYDFGCYTKDTKTLGGQHVSTNEQLSLQGWQVLTISPFSWNSMYLAESSARVQYLQETVRAAAN